MTTEDNPTFAELLARHRAALASPEFRAVIDDIKARCAAHAATRKPDRKVSDVQWDRDLERSEGWSLENIRNSNL